MIPWYCPKCYHVSYAHFEDRTLVCPNCGYVTTWAGLCVHQHTTVECTGAEHIDGQGERDDTITEYVICLDCGKVLENTHINEEIPF